MNCVISETEINYLLDLFQEIKSDSVNVQDMVDEIEQAEELLNGLVERYEKEQEALLEAFDLEEDSDESTEDCDT